MNESAHICPTCQKPSPSRGAFRAHWYAHHTGRVPEIVPVQTDAPVLSMTRAVAGRK